MSIAEGFIYYTQVIFKDNTPLLLLDILLVVGVVWLILKKSDSEVYEKLTKFEEDRLVENYQPEELVAEVPQNNIELKPRILQGKAGRYIKINGVKCLNFGCHNYLGMVGNKTMEKEARKCINVFGVGSCGPRGFYGTATEHIELEGYLAKILNYDSSIVYSYGFSTISSAIPAYAKRSDIIFVDEKRNFAIQQGLIASKSTIYIFKHNDTIELENMMENVRLNDLGNMKKAKRIRRYLVVEGIYINSGEVCPLPELVRLSKKYKVRLFIDESVSFGVLGKSGKGVTEYFEIPRVNVDLIMGSFEYALGSVGGFCAGTRLLTDHQQVAGQGYCFSASLPPLLAASTIAALRTIDGNPGILQKHNSLCKTTHYKLHFSTIINKYFVISGDQDSPVHLLSVKEGLINHARNGAVERIVEFCLYKQIAITRAAFLTGMDSAIDAPSLRVTTNLYNSEQHIDYLICVLEEACKHTFFK